MNIALIAVAIIVVIVGIVSSRTEPAGQTDEVVADVLPDESSEPTASPVPEPTKSSPVVEPTPSPAPQTPTPTNTAGWDYPGARTDSPEQITQWYIDKVNAEGFNVKNFVKTSANDNIKNVISAAAAGKSVEIEITKSPGDTFTTIEVKTSF